MEPKQVIAKAADALAESVASIINDRSVSEDEKLEMLALSFTQAEGYLAENLPAEMVKSADFVDAVDKSVLHSANRAIAFELPDGTRMKFPHKRAMATWLAAQERINKSEETMKHTTDNWRSIAKDFGVIEVAKHVIDNGAGSLDEHEFTKLVTEHARHAYPDMSPEQAFAKIFSADDESGKLLRQAHALTKSWPAPVSLEPLVSGGSDGFPTVTRRPGSSDGRKTRTEDGLGTAYEQLTQLAESQRRAGETASQAFARIYSDPAYKHLADAERAQSRPAYGVRIVE
jgi:hypothetical protein